MGSEKASAPSEPEPKSRLPVWQALWPAARDGQSTGASPEPKKPNKKPRRERPGFKQAAAPRDHGIYAINVRFRRLCRSWRSFP